MNAIRTVVVVFLISGCGGGGEESSPSHTYTYSGTVVATNGQAAPGVKISLTLHGDACPGLLLDGAAFGYATTDSAGAFSVSANASSFDGQCRQYRYYVSSESNEELCAFDRSKPCFAHSDTGMQYMAALQSASGIRLTPEPLYRIFGTIRFPEGLVPGTTDPYLKVGCDSINTSCSFANVIEGKFALGYVRGGYTYTMFLPGTLCASTAPAGMTHCNDKYRFTPSSPTVSVIASDVDVVLDAVPR